MEPITGKKGESPDSGAGRNTSSNPAYAQSNTNIDFGKLNSRQEVTREMDRIPAKYRDKCTVVGSVTIKCGPADPNQGNSYE